MTAMVFVLAAAAASSALAAEDAAAGSGGRDIVVTGQRSEGSDDYATRAQTTATRLPISQRETPQSVSVVTRAQIEDFQLNDVNALLASVPGVSVLAAETDRMYYSARGFDIQTFQIDGVGLPFPFGIQTGSLDTAIYDRIEVVKGAPGLLSPTGNPSALINFIRKRPYHDRTQAVASAQYGSYDHLRLDADVSVPVNASGSLRARGVGAYLDEDSYLDRYKLKRWTAYGIVEADLGPSTTLSVGYAHQDHQSHGAQWGALPLYYTDGTRIDHARSTSTGPDWSGWGVTDRQIFGDLTHDLGDGWNAKLTVLRRATDEDDMLFYVYGNPARYRSDGIDLSDPRNPKGVFSYPGAFKGDTRNLTIDAYVSGKLRVAGREHDVMIGVNRGAERYRQSSSYGQIGQPIPLGSLFDGSFPEPAFPPFTPSLDTHTRRETVYGLVRLNMADPFKVMLGGNYTHAQSEGSSYTVPTAYDRSKFLPFVGATYDFTRNLTAYASYAKIFRPQTEFDAANRLLAPVDGDNLEAGVKGEWANGRLNASAAVFQARQRNTAEAAGFDVALGRTIYRGVDAKSQGVELEVSGELAPGLQMTAGFTTMRVRREDTDAPARTFVPRNIARLNLSYAPPVLPALKLGTSIQYQSRIYIEPGALSDTTGEPIRVTQGGYALVDLLARYEITPHVALSANLRNVTNAKYLTSLTFDQGYYGAPRTLLGTLSVKY